MKIFLIILCIIALMILVVFAISYIQLRQFKVTSYHINKNIPKGLKGKKICFMSDYHEAAGGVLDKRIINSIIKENPDYILVGGDMITDSIDYEKTKNASDLLNALAERYKIFYTAGNHERRMQDPNSPNQDIWEYFTKALNPTITFLNNGRIYLNGIDSSDGTLYGLDIPTGFYGRFKHKDLTVKNVNKYLGDRRPGEYIILLAHNPMFFKTYKEWGADLVLSGHLHGGIIRLPFLGGVIAPDMTIFPKYCYGSYEEGNTRMIVTNGIGQHTINVKVNNTPEVVMLYFD